MLGSARGGGAVSRTLRGLYGGRVSSHVSIMCGSTPSRVPSQDQERCRRLGLVGSRTRGRLCRQSGSSLGLSVVGSRSARRMWCSGLSDLEWEGGGGPGGRQEEEGEEQQQQHSSTAAQQHSSTAAAAAGGGGGGGGGGEL